MTLKSVLQRLEATKDIKVEAATDLKGAAAFVEKALRKHKLDWKVKAFPDSNEDAGGYIGVSGKTPLGLINFAVHFDHKLVWFDWYDSSGIDVFEAYNRYVRGQPTIDSLRSRDLKESRRALKTIKKGLEASQEGVNIIEAYQNFAETLLNSIKK